MDDGCHVHPRLAPKIAIAVASELASKCLDSPNASHRQGMPVLGQDLGLESGDDPAVRSERLETLATFLAATSNTSWSDLDIAGTQLS